MSNILNPPIIFNSNADYRKTLRIFCNMDCSNNILTETINQIEDMDHETYDELLYDSDAMKNKMDEIYNNTKNDELWKSIYLSAAAKFFSTEESIGICILFTYDYFPFFYECYDVFLNNRENWSNTNESYKKILENL